MDNREEAFGLITCFVSSNRFDAVKNLWNWAVENGFLDAPASSGKDKHNAFEGGLLDHSVKVAHNLICVGSCGIGLEEYETESLVIIGLFHDIHKASDGFKNSYYVANVLKSGNVSESKPYSRNKNKLTFCGGYISVMIISKFVSLYDFEAQAIAHHDGLFVPEGKIFSMVPSQIHPLTYALHFADFWAGIYQEPPDSLLKKIRQVSKFCE